jgi:hypothetical protein
VLVAFEPLDEPGFDRVGGDAVVEEATEFLGQMTLDP